MASAPVILLLVQLTATFGAPTPLTDIYFWPGGFQSSFTVRASQRLGGWKAHLQFDTPIESLQVWKGTVYSVLNAGLEFVIQNKSTDGLLTAGEDLIVEVQGYTRSTTDKPQGTYYIEGYDGTSLPTPSVQEGSMTRYDYREALRLSVLFYDGQRSGKMPLNNPIPWREDSHVNDSDNGHDLSGGWYDGDSKYDHNYWGRPEDSTVQRPAYFVNATCPGSDVAAGIAGAMAAGAIVFNKSCPDADFSSKLRTAALGLYTFAKMHRGLYSDCLRGQTSIAYSSSDDRDELTSAAIWLYKLTGEVSYLPEAKTYHINGVPWALSWNDLTPENDLLLYEITKEDKYKSVVEAFIFGWMPGGQVAQTPCGLAWRDKWGSLRYATNTAFYALVAVDDNLYPEEYKKWALSQINYILGDNNYNMSYEIGFGDKFPVQYHHRGSSCPNTVKACDINDVHANYNLLKGGLVGGPDSRDQYADARQDYVKNEVALDYNAGFQGALAVPAKAKIIAQVFRFRMVDEYGLGRLQRSSISTVYYLILIGDEPCPGINWFYASPCYTIPSKTSHNNTYEPCSGKRGLNASPCCFVPSKTSHN